MSQEETGRRQVQNPEGQVFDRCGTVCVNAAAVYLGVEICALTVLSELNMNMQFKMTFESDFLQTTTCTVLTAQGRGIQLELK